MSDSIYVGNLQWRTTEEELEDFFKPYGKVISVKIIKEQESGRSKGFGFIEMDSEENAKKAIQNLDNTELNGRILKINSARKIKKF